MAGATQHQVKEGQCMSSIAVEYGFFWKTLWNHADNASLKDQRKNPNVLLPGDIVHIPELRKKSVAGGTEQTHRFVRKGVPSKVTLRLLKRDEPRASLRYEADCDGKTHEGETDDDGKLTFPVSPGATRAVLRLYEGDNVEERILQLGTLDPIDTIRGAQQRLLNLNHACPQDGKPGEGTKAAIKQFQLKYELDVTGQMDDTTQAKLQEIHKS